MAVSFRKVACRYIAYILYLKKVDLMYMYFMYFSESSRYLHVF